jgi:diacylglycerol kinase family enzyme
MGGDAGGRARRWWALAALATLPVMAGGLALVAVGSDGGLFGLVVGAVLGLAVVAASGWWAFTTRRVWKRRLNVAVAALVVASLLLDLLVVGLQGAAGVAVLAAGLLGYGAAARRALGAVAGPVDIGLAPTHPRPPARPWLLVNLRSGGGKAERLGIAAAARDRGVQVHELVPGDDPVALARQAVAAGADVVGVAGGDGSLGLVAAVAVEADVPFVCVPSGTRNHFAADLGLDRGDPLAALDAFAGPERRIDVGVVGERMFMNNVSLGAYADLVAEPGYRARKLTTAHAVLPGALRGERALLQVAFEDPGGRRYQDVLVLLVANNAYDLQGAVLGARGRLDGGVLQVSALRARTGAALAGLVARIAAGRAGPGASWAQWTATALRVDADVAELPAGIDGEAVTLAPPLEFRVLPLALRVLVPPALRPRAPRVALRSWATVGRLWAVATGRAGSAAAPQSDAGR